VDSQSLDWEPLSHAKAVDNALQLLIVQIAFSNPYYNFLFQDVNYYIIVASLRTSFWYFQDNLLSYFNKMSLCQHGTWLAAMPVKVHIGGPKNAK